MAQLAQSLVRLPWAVSLFAVQQFTNLLSGNRGRRTESAFYSVTQAVQEQFGDSPVFFGLNQLGDGVQRSAVDLAWDALSLKPLDPRWVGRTAGAAVRDSIDVARALTPGQNLQFTTDVLRNTFAVIDLVNRAPSMLQLPPGELDLGAAVDRAYELGGDYAALWLIEGLGEEYAMRNASLGGAATGLLTSGQGAKLPEKALLMMHAGMGIAFARETLRPLTPCSPEAELDTALRRFVAQVRANARPGYEGPALESLGLVTRTWSQQMVPSIDSRLWALDREALQYFWHGVGRAIYFDPRYLLPGTTAFHGVQREATHRLGMLNGIAGASWAFTLVNIQQPEVMWSLLRLYAGALGDTSALTNGVQSTVMMASDMIPRDPNVPRFCGYRPRSRDAGAAERWEDLVAAPCRRAVQDYFPVLKNRGVLGEVFRFSNFEQWMPRNGGASR